MGFRVLGFRTKGVGFRALGLREACLLRLQGFKHVALKSFLIVSGSARAPKGFKRSLQGLCKQGLSRFLPLVSSEWRNGSNSSYNCTPFLQSLLTKGKD